MKTNTSLQLGEGQLSENVVGRRFYEKDSDEEDEEVGNEMIFSLSSAHLVRSGRSHGRKFA